MKHRKLLALLSLVALAGCGGDDDAGGGEQAAGGGKAAIRNNPANDSTLITVGSKNFTEQLVLGEIYAQGLEAAGYRVRRKLDLGDEQTLRKAMTQGKINAYPEYTGTVLLSQCDESAEDIPKDPAKAFEAARKCLDASGLTAFPPTPFNSSNEIGVTQAVAQKHKLRRISDLARVDQDFTLYGSPECAQRSDCLLGLRDTYGLRFGRFAPVPIGRRHEVLERGDRIASVVFTTDPQVRRQNIVLLEDDKGLYPPQNTTFVLRDEVAESAGADLPKVLDRLQRGLTDEVMQELNARVDLDDEQPDAVAGQYLAEAGLVASG